MQIPCLRVHSRKTGNCTSSLSPKSQMRPLDGVNPVKTTRNPDHTSTIRVLSGSVVSGSLWPHGLQPARFLYPWSSPGKSTGVGCHLLLQVISPTQGPNVGPLCLLHWQADSLLLVPPVKLISVLYISYKSRKI